MEIIQVSQLEDIKIVVEKLLAMIVKVRSDRAIVVALSGELGAGKTTLTQILAKSLGIQDIITSPTYVVMKGYELDTPKLPHHQKFIHVDAYRIDDIDEMRVLKFPELLEEKDTIICIEWPEHITSLIPNDAVKVSIKIIGDVREVSIS